MPQHLREKHELQQSRHLLNNKKKMSDLHIFVNSGYQIQNVYVGNTDFVHEVQHLMHT